MKNNHLYYRKHFVLYFHFAFCILIFYYKSLYFFLFFFKETSQLKAVIEGLYQILQFAQWCSLVVDIIFCLCDLRSRRNSNAQEISRSLATCS